MPAISEFHPSLDASVLQFAAGLRRHESGGRGAKKQRTVVSKPPAGPRSSPVASPAARVPARATIRTAAPGAPRRVAATEAPGRSTAPLPQPSSPVDPQTLAVPMSSLPWGMPELPAAAAASLSPSVVADPGTAVPPPPRVGPPAEPQAAAPRGGHVLLRGEKQGFADVAIPLPPRRRKVLRDIAYLPVRAVNVVLAGALTLVSLGKAWPVLAYAAARMGESLGAVLDPLKKTASAREGEADFRTDKRVAGPAAPVRMSPADRYFKHQLINFRKKELPRRKSDAQWRLFGRSVSLKVSVGLFVAAAALTAVFPPLGLAAAVVGGLALWWSAANVLCANKSRRLAGSGKAALPAAGSALGNAFYRGRVESTGQAWIRWADHMKARAEAARFAKYFTIAWGLGGTALSVANAPAAVPSLAKFAKSLAGWFTDGFSVPNAPATSSIDKYWKSAAGWVASGISWIAERTAGSRPAQVHPTDWEYFDLAILAYRQALLVDGDAGGIAPVPQDVKAELLASGFAAEDLERFFSSDPTIRRAAPALRRAGDEPLDMLRQATDIGAAFVLGRAAIGTGDFVDGVMEA